MKVRHYLAALVLAVSAGQQVYAQDAQTSDGAPATASETKDSAASQEKPARHAKKHSRREDAVSPARTVVAAADPVDNTLPKQEAAVAKQESTPAAEENAAPKTESTPAPPENAPVKADPAPVKQEAVSTQPASAAAPQAEKPADPPANLLHDVKITDVLLAVFAGLLVLLGWVQARRLREAVHAAKDSANIAEKSARLAEDALIAGQRAFMFIREIKTYLHHDPQTSQYRWTIHPVWANSGNTPTRGLSINTTYRLLDQPLPKDFDFPQSREDLIPTIAGPKSMVEALPGALSAEDLEAVQKGAKYFYIWGWAEYHDIFEGTRKHITRFCNQLTQVEGDPKAPYDEHNPVQMLFDFHTENNYAD